nr:MAG TPA: hypothetical protein [Caudoviricetes sp.]
MGAKFGIAGDIIAIGGINGFFGRHCQKVLF